MGHFWPSPVLGIKFKQSLGIDQPLKYVASLIFKESGEEKRSQAKEREESDDICDSCQED